MKYEIILYWSEDDEAYIAEVPELSGWEEDKQQDHVIAIRSHPHR